MAGIICFETEWEIVDSKNRLRTNSEHLMRYLSEEFGIHSLYRRIATKEELEFYMNEIPIHEEYNSHNIIYFSFHGDTHLIQFANGKDLRLEDLADINPNFFRNKFVHFGSCRTMLGSEDVMANFYYRTRAKIVSGYTKKVDSDLCAIHDIALFDAYMTRKQLPGIMQEMQKFYGGLEEYLGFTTFPKFDIGY